MNRRFGRAYALLASALVSGCLPIPNRIVDAVAVSGVIQSHGRPVAGLRVAVDQPTYTDAGQLRDCLGAAAVLTDAKGVFQSAVRKKWRAWVFLLGESADWNIPTRVCVYRDSTWRAVYFSHINAWDPELHVVCDLDMPPTVDKRTGKETVCKVEAPSTSLRHEA